jgi:hypothetical protein
MYGGVYDAEFLDESDVMPYGQACELPEGARVMTLAEIEQELEGAER